MISASRSGGEADWEFIRRLARIGRLIINIGNHDFDFQVPCEFRRRLRDIGGELIGTIYTPDCPQLYHPYADISAGSRIVRIVGISADLMMTYPAKLQESLSIPDPQKWIKDHWTQLCGGADTVILASHAGLTPDTAMLKSISDSAHPLFAAGGHDHITVNETSAGIPYMINGFRGEQFSWAELHDVGGSVTPRFFVKRTSAAGERDEHMRKFIQQEQEQYLSDADRQPVGSAVTDMSVQEAALWAVKAVRSALNADAAFLNHTSFGSGLRKGPIPKYEFDELIRFDNDLLRTIVDGETLQDILSRCNQHQSRTIAQRSGDFLYTEPIEPEKGRNYEIAASSWVAMEENQKRYLGTVLNFEKVPDLTLKQVLQENLSQQHSEQQP